MTSATSARKATYGVATGLVVLAFVIPGIGTLAHVPHFVQDMARLGYPSYFPTILGTWKLLGAAAIAVPRFPRLKEWAYAGMIFDLTGAAVSRAMAGDPVLTVVVPLVIASVTLISWALRPPARTLASESSFDPEGSSEGSSRGSQPSYSA